MVKKFFINIIKNNIYSIIHHCISIVKIGILQMYDIFVFWLQDILVLEKPNNNAQ